MSHLVTIKTEVRDPVRVRAACRRLGLPAPVGGKVRLFGSEAEGLAVQLPDWRYPIVCDTASGQVKFDNFNGNWGKQEHLDAFLQAYAVEKAKIEARKKGYAVTEKKLKDGTIELEVRVP